MSTYPNNLEYITIIIIGINVESTIHDCLLSVQNLNYPKEKIETLYVDSGSKDKTLQIVKEFPNVRTLHLKTNTPTAALGRNTGWKEAKGTLIQFLDGDTTISPNWLLTAVPQMTDSTGAIIGQRSEKFPKKNIFHLISHLELNSCSGVHQTFGGDVLIRKKILENLSGYDSSLIAGEEPDLSYRVRKSGWSIYGLSEMMTHHDIAMNSFKQYFKRSFRSGHAYAEVSFRYFQEPEKFWMKELLRITLGALLPWIIFFILFSLGYTLLGILSFIGISFRSMRNILKLKMEKKLSWKEAFFYNLHLCIVIYPQSAGAFSFFLKKGLR